MHENEQPGHDLLEEAIHAFQQMSVPERPAGEETLALISAGQGDLEPSPSGRGKGEGERKITLTPALSQGEREHLVPPSRIPHSSPRGFFMYAIISSTAAAVLAFVGVPLFLWNAWAPKPKPEPVPVAVTKAPGQSQASLADPPAALNRAPKEDLGALPVPRLEDTVKESQVVVVATAESFSPAPPSKIPGDTPEVLIQFKVKRVLKGKYAAKTFTTRLSNEKIAGRDQVSQIVGKDWVACLSSNFLAGKSQSAPLTSAEFEKRYKDIIAKEMK
jgi:hypothetical protein